jgi:hypothetical protein
MGFSESDQGSAPSESCELRASLAPIICAWPSARTRGCKVGASTICRYTCDVLMSCGHSRAASASHSKRSAVLQLQQSSCGLRASTAALFGESAARTCIVLNNSAHSRLLASAGYRHRVAPRLAAFSSFPVFPSPAGTALVNSPRAICR